MRTTYATPKPINESGRERQLGQTAVDGGVYDAAAMALNRMWPSVTEDRFKRGEPRLITKVGFYGCANRVVRLAVPRPRRRYPKRLRMECPACKHEHDIFPFWRNRVESMDADKTPDAVISPEVLHET